MPRLTQPTKRVIMETKKCTKCGRVLPISEFNKSRRHKDGLQYYCRDCQHETNREVTSLKKKLLSDNPLSCYTPRELMAELKQRGYKWDKMYYTQEVKYENI